MSKDTPSTLVALIAVLPISYLIITFFYWIVGLIATGLFNYTLFPNINYWLASLYIWSAMFIFNFLFRL
jgi:hypothetical protein